MPNHARLQRDGVATRAVRDRGGGGRGAEEVRKSKIAQLLYLEHDGARVELVSD